MTASPPVWRIVLTAPTEAQAAVFGDALEAMVDAVAASEVAPRGPWRLEAYASAPPDRGALAARLGVAAAAAGIAPPEIAIERLADTDWVRESQARLPPVEVGRFQVRGSHITMPVPNGLIGILIDAGAAFGTGSHESTRGCLIAFSRLAEGREVDNALDLGSGSGVLAIAIAKLWGARALAADNDATAVAVAAENAALNGVDDRVRVVRSDGFRNRAIGVGAPYDLIAANILARPLARMAPTIARALASHGAVVLSGILAQQADDVIAAARAGGMEITERVVLGEWHTLMFAPPKA